MIHPAARDLWRDLEAKLRPFVARRVRDPAAVDDVVQEVFLRMHRGLAGLRDEQRLGPWVYRVARNAIADHHRQAARHPLAASDATDPEVPDLGEDERVIERELAGYVAPFVATLPSPYREALTLTELEGLTQQQAADLLGISLSGMKSRVQRGRRRLRAAFEDCCLIALDVRGRVMSCELRPDGKVPDGCCDEQYEVPARSEGEGAAHGAT